MKHSKARQHDAINPKVIKEVAGRLNITESKVKDCISHFFQWQREAFNNVEYEEYLWNNFGTFSVIQSKYEKWLVQFPQNTTYEEYIEKLRQEKLTKQEQDKKLENE